MTIEMKRGVLRGGTMSLRATILKIASKKKTFRTSDVLRALRHRYSRQHVSAALREMVRAGTLVKAGSTRGAVYSLPRYIGELGVRIRRIKRRYRNKELKEDDVLDQLRHSAPFLRTMPRNVNRIFTYAFLEILNNAIEHSGSRYIDVEIIRADRLTFIVSDFGVGVFRKVMRDRGLHSEFEAIQDLLKGKTTTAPERHSGEGIFFTSKVADVFLLESYRNRMRVDNKVGDVFIERPARVKRGTKATFMISVDSSRKLEGVFRLYSADLAAPAFDRSEVKVKLFARETGYVSRSEARRLLVGLEKFRTVVLDFDRIATIGQAFADEIFRVFQQRHPGVQIIPVNMDETVKFMVDRARQT